MRWMTAAAIAIGLGLAFSTARAADLKNTPPMPLNDQQLATVTAAGTIFLGALKGDDVVFSRTIHDVPVMRELDRQVEIDGLTVRVISTRGDILIPPPPFPQ